MKKLLFCLLFASSLAVLHSCSEKNESDNLTLPETQLFDVSAAIDYFKNQIGQVSVMDMTSSSGTITRSNPMARSRWNEPNWSQAKSYEMDGKAIVKIPLQTDGIRATCRHTHDEVQPGKESGIRSVLLLVKEQDREVKPMIVTYITENKEDFDIVAPNVIDPHFSGIVCFSTIKGRMISGLVVKNGKTTHPLLNRPVHAHSDACAEDHDHENEIAGGGAEAAHTAAGIEICLTKEDVSTITTMESSYNYYCEICKTHFHNTYSCPNSFGPCSICGSYGHDFCTSEGPVCGWCSHDVDSYGNCNNPDCMTNKFQNCYYCNWSMEGGECTNAHCVTNTRWKCGACGFYPPCQCCTYCGLPFDDGYCQLICNLCYNQKHYGPCPGY